MTKLNETLIAEGYFEIDDIPHQKGAFDLVVLGANVGVYRVGDKGGSRQSIDWLVNPTIFSQWTDSGDTPYPSIGDLLTDLRASFFLTNNRGTERVTDSTLTSGKNVGVTDAATNAPIIITLSSFDIANSMRKKLLFIKDESGGATADNITIATEGAQTIDGVASIVLTVNYAGVFLYSDENENVFTL